MAQQSGQDVALHLRFRSPPVKHTWDSPVLGRSQISTWFPAAANSLASSWTPGVSRPNRPPGVMTHGRPVPMTS